MYQCADFNRKTAYQDMFKYLRTNYDLRIQSLLQIAIMDLGIPTTFFTN